MSYNIMLVDNSKVIRRMIAEILMESDIDIGSLYEAWNGEEALYLLEKYDVDLVLSDMRMPVMNGAKMVETMANRGLLKTVSVIMVSAEGENPYVMAQLLERVSAYVKKPFTPEAIRKVVCDVLGEGQSE